MLTKLILTTFTLFLLFFLVRFRSGCIFPPFNIKEHNTFTHFQLPIPRLKKPEPSGTVEQLDK